MSELNTARLRSARERIGLNQITLSRLLKVSPGLAGQWERTLGHSRVREEERLAPWVPPFPIPQGLG